MSAQPGGEDDNGRSLAFLSQVRAQTQSFVGLFLGHTWQRSGLTFGSVFGSLRILCGVKSGLAIYIGSTLTSVLSYFGHYLHFLYENKGLWGPER